MQLRNKLGTWWQWHDQTTNDLSNSKDTIEATSSPSTSAAFQDERHWAVISQLIDSKKCKCKTLSEEHIKLKKSLWCVENRSKSHQPIWWQMCSVFAIWYLHKLDEYNTLMLVWLVWLSTDCSRGIRVTVVVFWCQNCRFSIVVPWETKLLAETQPLHQILSPFHLTNLLCCSFSLADDYPTLSS